jgi:cyclomaltodextrinase
MKKLEIGKYKHFKGGEYKVIGIAKHSETLEDFVVYKALYGKKDLWIRPLKMFLENVIVKGKKVERFKKINQKILIKPRKK